MKLDLPFCHFVEEPVGTFEHSYTGSSCMRPENHNSATWLQHPMKLREDLLDFLTREMFQHAKIVDAVEAPSWKRKVQDVSVTDSKRRWVITLVNLERRRR